MASWILAIDFGTTATAAAMRAGDRIEVVEFGGSPRMPSAVLAADSGDLVVGAAAETQLSLAADRAERTPKRRLGDEVMLLGSRVVRPVEAVAAILRAVAAEAIRRQGGTAPTEVRLTHPASWGSVRRQKLAEAAVLAGLPEPVFVPEPVAAAVHFADERIVPGAFVAVYDLGGGTFDTAVLRRSADGFDVVGLPGGDERLGGEVFDERLFEHVGSRIAAEDPDAWEALRFSTERSWRKAGHDLRVECRQAKEALSANADYTVYVGAPVDLTVLVSRDELEALIHDDVVATIDELEATVKRAGIGVDDLAAINLVGGSSRIPLVTRLVAERFGKMPQTWGDPKAAVAVGAAKATRLTSVTSGSGSSSGGRRAGVAPLPATVGGCQVVAELGRGGMGVVFLARQASVDRLVAVKTLPILDAGLTERLRREGAVLAELQHPHISTVIDVGDDERGTYVVMPYYPGGTVAHVLDHSGALAAGAAVTVLAAVAEALAATHGKGFLHRDVKPSNVLLNESGDPYLADFGLALPMQDSSRLTNSRAVLGTAPYTAPEILADETPTPASDVYALGVTGYQLLTAHLPYDGSNVMAVLSAVSRGAATPILELAPDAPAELAALVESAFAADPADRPSDLRAWAAQVRAAAAPEPVRPAPPVSWTAALAAAGAIASASAAEAAGAEGAAAAAIVGAGGPVEVPDDVADVVGFGVASSMVTSNGGDGPPTGPIPLGSMPPPTPAGGRRRLGRRAIVAIAAAFVLLAGVAGATVLTGGGDKGDEVAASADGTTTTTATATSATTDTTGTTLPVVVPGPGDSIPPIDLGFGDDGGGGNGSSGGGNGNGGGGGGGGAVSFDGTCVNGIDDDGDGLNDGSDPQCAGAPRSANETTNDRAGCTNGRDDDGDTYVDAQDPNCSGGGASETTNDFPAPVISLAPGPTSINACHRYNWRVVVQNASSGSWVDSDNFSKNGDLFFTDFFNDLAYENAPRAEWIRYTATGPGGTRTATINISVFPDPDAPDYVRPDSECRSYANSTPVQN